MPKNTGPDYYEILGVDYDASPQEIIAAYRQRQQECHNDRQRLRLLRQAKSKLGDPELRKQYDQENNIAAKKHRSRPKKPARPRRIADTEPLPSSARAAEQPPSQAGQVPVAFPRTERIVKTEPLHSPAHAAEQPPSQAGRAPVAFPRTEVMGKPESSAGADVQGGGNSPFERTDYLPRRGSAPGVGTRDKTVTHTPTPGGREAEVPPAPLPPAFVDIVLPDGRWWSFPLGPGETKIGRCADNDIVLEDPIDKYVSRHHAYIIARDGNYYVLDKKSANRTRLDGERIAQGREYLLADGSVIEIEQRTLTFHLGVADD